MGKKWIAAMAAGLAMMAACGGRKETQTAEEAVAVRVRAPQAVDRGSVIRAGGNVEAREQSKVGFQVAGRLKKIYVEEGQSVRAGQLLAELDAADYQYGAEMAAGEASAAKALADKARAGARKQELEQAKAAFEQADDEYRRMKQLFERKSLAPNDFHKIEAHWTVTRARYDEAKEGARVEDRAAAEAKSQQAAAAARLNQKRVADTKLYAPLAGVIGKRLNDPGEIVAAGMPVVVVLDLNPVRVRVGVPESDIAKVRAGKKATVRIPALGGEGYSGRVELVGFAAEPQSRTFDVRVLAANPKLELRAGMIAEVEIEGDTRVQALTVPAEAIVRDAQGAPQVYVYYPEKQRVFGRRVETGRALGREVEITQGLKDGEQVVIAGQQRVREGGLVKLAEVQK